MNHVMLLFRNTFASKNKKRKSLKANFADFGFASNVVFSDLRLLPEIPETDERYKSRQDYDDSNG